MCYVRCLLKSCHVIYYGNNNGKSVAIFFEIPCRVSWSRLVLAEFCMNLVHSNDWWIQNLILNLKLENQQSNVEWKMDKTIWMSSSTNITMSIVHRGVYSTLSSETIYDIRVNRLITALPIAASLATFTRPESMAQSIPYQRALEWVAL